LISDTKDIYLLAIVCVRETKRG